MRTDTVSVIQHDILTNPYVSSSLLLVLFVDAVGVEGLNWEPGTVKEAIEKEFSVKIPRNNYNKLMAAISIATSDAYWKDLPSFIILTNALYSGKFDPRIFDAATTVEIAVGLVESVLIYPIDVAREMSVGIINYIEKTLDLEWMIIPPTVFQKLFPDRFTVQYEKLLSLKEDPLLYQAAFTIAGEKMKDIDQEVIDRLALAKQHAEMLGLKAAKVYEETILELS